MMKSVHTIVRSVVACKEKIYREPSVAHAIVHKTMLKCLPNRASASFAIFLFCLSVDWQQILLCQKGFEEDGKECEFMKKLFLLLRAQYRSLLLFCASGVSAMALFCTIDISQQWLIYTTHVTASINYMQLFFVAVWYIFGGASVCIPLALFCFGFARWHSIKMGCEQLFLHCSGV